MQNNMNHGCPGSMNGQNFSMPIAMAYVPWQDFRKLDNLKNGYHCGTIFNELNKPFLGGKYCK